MEPLIKEPLQNPSRMNAAFPDRGCQANFAACRGCHRQKNQRRRPLLGKDAIAARGSAEVP